MIFYAMQQIDIAFEANKTQPPPAPSKGNVTKISINQQRHCGLDPQSPDCFWDLQIAGQARNDAVGKYRHLIIDMTLVFSLYSSDITSTGGQCIPIPLWRGQGEVRDATFKTHFFLSNTSI
jgi:hypothetical protein